jgi:toxin ParE1/3/4
MSSRERPRRVILSPKARQDFIDILRYTGETWGKGQLHIYRDKINDALQSNRQRPEAGHHRDDLPATHFAYLVGSHVIVYRTGGDTIGVVRILHQRMSLGRHV